MIRIAVSVILLSSALVAVELLPESRFRVVSYAFPGELGAKNPEFWPIGTVPDLFVAYATAGGALYGIDDAFIYSSNDGGHRFERVGQLPEKYPGLLNNTKELVARSKLVRALRSNIGPRNLVVLGSGTVLVIGAGGIYRSTDNGHNFSLVFDLEMHGFYGPMDNGVAVTPDDVTYFGEYVADQETHPIRILQGLDDGRDWKVAHRFEPGEIRHIHSLQYDSHRDRIWVCTGDRDEEAKLLWTADHFDSLHVLGDGSQDWRIVSVIATPRYLYWGSDNDTPEGASIFRWDFEESRVQELQHIGKPAYFSTVLQDGTLAISTAYEPESPYSKAVSPTPSSDIWMSRDGENWTNTLRVSAYVEDEVPNETRAYVSFPGGDPLPELVFSRSGTMQHNHSTTFLRQRQILSAARLD